MRIRYTPQAGDDLSAILRYIDERSPQGAQNVKRAIQNTIQFIAEFPKGGRRAGEEPTHALPAGRYPYLIYWIVQNNEVWITHIRDTRRKPLRR